MIEVVGVVLAAAGMHAGIHKVITALAGCIEPSAYGRRRTDRLFHS
jgi:hypothetical protein